MSVRLIKSLQTDRESRLDYEKHITYQSIRPTFAEQLEMIVVYTNDTTIKLFIGICGFVFALFFKLRFLTLHAYLNTLAVIRLILRRQILYVSVLSNI